MTINPAIDVSCSVDHVFPNHKLRCGPGTYEAGGGGVNVARAITQLGGASRALYLAGGLTGKIFEDLLNQEGLFHQPVQIRGSTREDFSVIESATGQQFRFVLPGPAIDESEWRGLLDRIAGLSPFPEFVVASGSLAPGVPMDFYGRLATIVRGQGAKLVLDTSGEPLVKAMDVGVFLVKPSLRELRGLAGRDLAHEHDQEEAAREICKEGQAQIVVVSLGAAGVLLVSNGGCERMRSPTVAVKSKIGAGDSMVAGIVLSLARGLGIGDAVRYGVAAGAAAVMREGTKLCAREDTDRLYLKMESAHTVPK